MFSKNTTGSPSKGRPNIIQLGEDARQGSLARRPWVRFGGISFKRVAALVGVVGLIVVPNAARSQVREYGPKAFKTYPSGHPLYTNPGNPNLPTGTAELVRSVLIGTDGAGTIDKLFVLSDVHGGGITGGPSPEERDYALTKITWPLGVLTDSVTNVVDMGSYSVYSAGNGYSTHGIDRLGGAVLDNTESYIYTVGMCNTSGGGTITDTAKRFMVNRFNTSNLSLSSGVSGRQVPDSGWSGTFSNWTAAEGNAIGIDRVRNRLFVAGSRTASGSRDVVVTEYDLNLSYWPSVGQPLVLSRTGDDTALYISVHNVNSTTTKVFVSGYTSAAVNTAGALTYGLTETNSGTWTENWRCAFDSRITGGSLYDYGVRNNGFTVSPNLSDVYVVMTEGEVIIDDETSVKQGSYSTKAYHITAGSGTISSNWNTGSLGAEPSGSGGSTSNVPGGFEADANGNLWLTWSAYVSGSLHDIRVARWANTGPPATYSYYYDSGVHPDIPIAGVLDPRSNVNKFYVLGNTTVGTPGMHAGYADTSGLSYPSQGIWSAATDPWSTATPPPTLPLTSLSRTAIKSGVSFTGADLTEYDCVLAAVRAQQTGPTSWEDGDEETGDLKKFKYHSFEVTLYGIN